MIDIIEEQLNIVKGPSKNALFGSMQSCGTSSKIEVVFNLEEDKIVAGIISGLRLEDETGDYFSFEGTFTTEGEDEAKFRTGFYNTKTLEGKISI